MQVVGGIILWLIFTLAIEWQPILVALTAAIGGLLASVISWLIAKRQTSGSISTSDASTLWSSAEQIRKELKQEVIERREENKELREENDKLKNKLDDLQDRLSVAESEIRRLQVLVKEEDSD